MTLAAADVIAFTWTAGAMVPLPKEDVQHLVDGKVYRLREARDRSQEEHSRFFARLTELWENLREEYVDRFPTMHHLRKWCLIKAGFRNERIVPCANREEALRGAMIGGIANEYAVILVGDNVVTIYTAKSQSLMKMHDRKEFHASQEAVLAIAEGMVMAPLAFEPLPPLRRKRKSRKAAAQRTPPIPQRQEDVA